MFIWKDDYSVKIDIIDEQHKELFKIGNKAKELSDTFTEDKYDEILEILDELRNYTIFHFATEERLFEKYNYPDYEEHRAAHQKFVETLKSVDPDSIDENHDEALKQILNSIAKWVFKHIMYTDFKYSEFLIDAMK